MKLLCNLWGDECGAILSAELVMVGTLGVVGVTVGLASVSHSVNEEMKELAMAFRSLDQSYCVEGQHGCRAWTAGSCYQQPDVEESLAELQGYIDEREGVRDKDRPGHDDDDDDRDDRRRSRYGDDDDDDDDRRDRRDRDRDDDDDDRDDRRRDRDEYDDDERRVPQRRDSRRDG